MPITGRFCVIQSRFWAFGIWLWIPKVEELPHLGVLKMQLVLLLQSKIGLLGSFPFEYLCHTKTQNTQRVWKPFIKLSQTRCLGRGWSCGVHIREMGLSPNPEEMNSLPYYSFFANLYIFQSNGYLKSPVSFLSFHFISTVS